MATTRSSAPGSVSRLSASPAIRTASSIWPNRLTRYSTRAATDPRPLGVVRGQREQGGQVLLGVGAPPLEDGDLGLQERGLDAGAGPHRGIGEAAGQVEVPAVPGRAAAATIRSGAMSPPASRRQVAKRRASSRRRAPDGLQAVGQALADRSGTAAPGSGP